MVFSLSDLRWTRIRGLGTLPDGSDSLTAKLRLILMGGALLSTSLIQFYVDGWGYVPSLLFDLRPNYGGGNEDNGDLLQKVLFRHCLTQCPQACSGPPLTHTSTRLLNTHRKLWVSLWWGHWSFLLGPSVHKILFVSSKSWFHQSYVSCGSSMVGLMAPSSKRVYSITRSTAPRAPALKQSTADPYCHRRHSNTVLYLLGISIVDYVPGFLYVTSEHVFLCKKVYSATFIK